MRLRLPHPLVLLLGGVAVAALLTWLLPAGAYQRRTEPATGREVVVAGTYARVAPTPVGPVGAVLAAPRGIIAGADVIVVVLLVGGAFALLETTGALGRLVGALVGRTRRPRLVLVVVCLLFATLGALENMQEEIIPLMPVLVVLSRGLGFGAVTAVGMSLGSAAIGAG
ncbi:MAG: YfcC family protein, partial [Gemmatimonadaceae bacterium]